MKREYIITFFSLLLAAYVGFVIYQKHYHPDQFHRRYINNLSEYKASASEVVANADSILTVYSRSENRLVRAEFRILGKQETYSYGDQYAVFIESFDKNTFKNTEKLWNKKLSSDHVRITKNKTLKYQLKKYPTNAQSYDDGQNHLSFALLCFREFNR